jgi:hypothetical protein
MTYVYCRLIPFLRYLDPDPLLLAVSALETNVPLNKKFHALNQAIVQLVRSINYATLHMISLLAYVDRRKSARILPSTGPVRHGLNRQGYKPRRLYHAIW